MTTSNTFPLVTKLPDLGCVRSSACPPQELLGPVTGFVAHFWCGLWGWLAGLDLRCGSRLCHSRSKANDPNGCRRFQPQSREPQVRIQRFPFAFEGTVVSVPTVLQGTHGNRDRNPVPEPIFFIHMLSLLFPCLSLWSSRRHLAMCLKRAAQRSHPFCPSAIVAARRLKTLVTDVVLPGATTG